MGHIGNGAHGQWGHGGQWGTRVCSKRVCSTWAMGHMGDGAHGQWGTWVMGYISIIKQEQDPDVKF